MADPEYVYSIDQIEQLLKCSVCLDRYKTPKLLPCQHTYCHQPCLEGLVCRRTGTIRCPECRADHIVPRHGTASFPNNLTVIGFLELASQRQRSASEFQYEESQATGPSPQQLPPRAAGAVGGTASSECVLCRREERLSSCFHCNQSICDSCKTLHITNLKSEIGRLIQQIRREIPTMNDTLASINLLGSELQQRCDIAKGEISETIEKHVKELRNRQRVLHGEIDTFLLSELRSLRQQKENAEVDLASTSSICDSNESLIGRSYQNISDQELVEIKRNCTENLEYVTGYQTGRIRQLRKMEIGFEDQFLSNTINNLGELILTGGSQFTLPSRRHEPEQEEDSRSARSDGRDTGTEPGATYGAHRSLTDRNASALTPLARRENATSQPPDSSSGVDDSSWSLRGADDGSISHRSLDDSPRSLRCVEDNSRNLRIPGQFSTPPVRRRARRDHHSDPRISSLSALDCDGPTRDRALRRARHRSTGGLSTTLETSDSEMNVGSSSSGSRLSPTNALSVPSNSSFGAASRQYSGRPSVRFDMPPSSSSRSPGSQTEEDDSVVAYNHSSPSTYTSNPRNKYNQKGHAVVQFGQRGTENTHFTWPRGVAVSPVDNYVYVADSSNHRVQVFDENGRYVKTFGAYGQTEGQFDCLAGIAVNGLNQIIVADRYNHRIQIFNRSGTCQFVFGQEGSNEGQLSYPWGIATDNMGFIYVCDKENHRVQVFQSNGAFVRKFGRYGTGAGNFDNPHYIAVSNDNRIYVSDSSNHRIQVFSIYGDFLFTFGSPGSMPGQMMYPRGIAIDNQGFVVVADSGNNRIQIFRADGRFYSMFGSWGNENGKFKGLEGVSILYNGNVVVSDRENHRIQIF